MPIQLIIIAFACFAIFNAWRAYNSGSLDRRKLLWWTVFWLIAAVVILLPQTTTLLANLLGVGRGADLVLYFSVVLLFYGVFAISRKVDRLDRHLTELVRQVALGDAGRNNDYDDE